MMQSISDDKMKEIKGGAINLKLIAIATAIGSFIIGIIDGFTNPQKCNS